MTKQDIGPKVSINVTEILQSARRFMLGDFDDFSDADATADTERWASDYLTGTEGGSADINTTTSGKLMLKVDPDSSPTAATYGVLYSEPLESRYYQTIVDLSTTFGTQTSGNTEAGIMITKSSAYDSTNYLTVSRYNTSSVHRVSIQGTLNSVAITTINATVTDNAIALRVDRTGDMWKFYYSLSQSPTEDWVFLGEVDDSSAYMTDRTTPILYSYSSGGNTDNIVQGDFDNWKLYISAMSLDEAIGNIGRNTADNLVSTSSVVGDVDGSILERQEALQAGLQIVAGAGTGFEADGTGATLYKTLIAKESITTGVGTTATYTDSARTEGSGYWIGDRIVTLSGGAAGQVRTIVGDNGAGTLTVEPLLSAAPGNSIAYVILTNKGADYILGDNTASNAYSSSTVVFDGDGSVLERLETLQKIRYNSTIYTSSAATTTTITAAALADVASQYIGQLVIPLEGAMAGEARYITAYNGTSALTVSPAWASDPDASGNIQFAVVSSGLSIVPTALGTDGTTVTDSATTVLGAIGANSTDNSFASTNVTANSNGSVLERLEHLLIALGGTTGTTTSGGSATTAIDTARTQADDYWNGGIFVCVDGVNAGLARPIYDFVATSDTLYFEPAFPSTVATSVNYIILTRYDVARIIGDDNTNNAISTSNIAANEDGSILERLEQIQEAVNVGTGTSMASNKSIVNALGTDGTTAAVATAASAVSLFGAIGTNEVDATTPFASGNVQANEDGSVLERLEQLQEAVNNGSGTSITTNKSLVDVIGQTGAITSQTGDIDAINLQNRLDANNLATGIVAAAAADGFEEDGTGGRLYDVFNSTDANANVFSMNGGTGYNDNLFSFLKTLSKYTADGDGDFAAGTVLPANKSLYDILHVDKYTDTGNTTGFTCTAAMAANETDIATLTNGTALTGTTRRKITYWLDMTNIDADVGGGNCTIRVKAKVDEANYRTMDTITWVNGTSDNGVLIEIPPFHHNLQVTFQMSVALAGNVPVPYRIVTENMEY